MGLINFAGGTGDWSTGGKICGGREQLIRAVGQLGERNGIPGLWLYAKNDRSFDPPLATAMFTAYSSSSPTTVALVATPVMGTRRPFFVCQRRDLNLGARREWFSQQARLCRLMSGGVRWHGPRGFGLDGCDARPILGRGRSSFAT